MGTLHRHPRMPDRAPTLAAYAGEVDEQRYRCPPDLSRRLDVLLDQRGAFPILGITGRGGAGKSAALRELVRRARRAGWPVLMLDAGVDAVVDAVEQLVDSAPHLVVIDEAGGLGAGLTAVGRSLGGLPSGTRLVVAGRTLPPRWLPDELAPLAATVHLTSLSRGESDALLERYGVTDPCARARIADWASGLALALVVGARAWAVAADREEEGAIEAALAHEGGEDLLRHLVDTALDELDPDLLAVLALGTGVDHALLAALFPGRAEELATELRSTSVVETIHGRLALHPSLAELLGERLRVEEPGRVVAAVMRVAAHEHARASAGETAAMARLATLVQDPGLRVGLGPTTLATYYPDRWRPGDTAAVRAGLDRYHLGAWDVVRPWLGDAVRLVRRADGRPVALIASLPLAAGAGVNGPCRRLVAPVIEYARAHGIPDRAVMSAVQITFDDLEEPEVAWVRNAAGLSQCGVGNPRADYANVVGDQAAERDLLEAFGYVEIAELARSLDGVPVTTWVADVGAGGLAGLLYAAIAEEQGRPVLADDGNATLIAALEGFHSDTTLAALPIAQEGLGTAAAAESVRAWTRIRVADLLVGEPVLLDLVQRRYFTPEATNESVLRATYLSRATYFRRLRRARDLLTEPRTPG